MNTPSRTACALAIAATVSVSLHAQWPSYPTPGVPRTADGKPILDGPAPRTADGKVDFSGIWGLGGFGGGGGGGRGRGAGAGGGGRGGAAAAPAATPATATAAAPAAAAPAAAPDPNAIPTSQFFEVAGRGFALPLQPWAAELKKKRMADNSKDNPDVW